MFQRGRNKDAQKVSQTPTSPVHLNFNSNDEEGWESPAWCNYRSRYSYEEESVKYEGRDIRNLSFKGARMIMGEFNHVDGRDVDFAKAQLSGADFRNADLRSANFSEADLCKADLSNANLCGANLAGADLLRTSFAGANLRGANLSGTSLDETDLTDASFDQTTELPFDVREALRRGMRREDVANSGGMQ
jgi:uncharacterized protein YjbI with pentapeptide repeats